MLSGWVIAATTTGTLCIAAAAAAIRTRRRNRKFFESLVAARLPLGADGIVLGAEPVVLQGSASRAVLVVHGFGDTPQSVRPLVEALHAAGWTVHAPLLPGHGRALARYAEARDDEWIAAVETAYTRLCAQYRTVVVCGISMGAALSVILAARHPELPALVLLAPYLAMPQAMERKALLATLTEFVWPYHASVGGENSIHDPKARERTLGTGVVTGTLLRQLQKVAERAHQALPLVKARTLYLQSREDNRIDANAAVEHFARLGSSEKVQRWLTGCGHIITIDYCKGEVAKQVVDWLAPVP